MKLFRWDLLDLLRLGVRHAFRPEDYLRVASCEGVFAGLPLAPASVRALDLPVLHDAGPGALIRRDVAYLAAWAARAGVESWSARGIWIASVLPARLPWRDDSSAVLIVRERWPEGFKRWEDASADGDAITVADVDAFASRATVAGARLANDLRAARFARMGMSLVTRPIEVRAALEAWQRSKGLAVSGVFDAATDAALVHETPASQIHTTSPA